MSKLHHSIYDHLVATLSLGPAPDVQECPAKKYLANTNFVYVWVRTRVCAHAHERERESYILLLFVLLKFCLFKFCFFLFLERKSLKLGVQEDGKGL